MHSTNIVPAGRGVDIEFIGDKSYLTAKIVEPVAVRLVEEGVYQGYSIGIADGYITSDPLASQGRIIVDLVDEVSIVDYPANPEANSLDIVKIYSEKAQQLLGENYMPFTKDADKDVTKDIEELQKEVANLKNDQAKDAAEGDDKKEDETVTNAINDVSSAVDSLAQAQAKDNAKDNKADVKKAKKAKKKKKDKCGKDIKKLKAIHDLTCPAVSVKQAQKNFKIIDLDVLTKELAALTKSETIDSDLLIRKANAYLAGQEIKVKTIEELLNIKKFSTSVYQDLIAQVANVNVANPNEFANVTDKPTDVPSHSVGSSTRPLMDAGDLLTQNQNVNIPITKSARVYYTNVSKDSAAESLVLLHDYICQTHPDICQINPSAEGNLGTTYDAPDTRTASVPTIEVESKGQIVTKSIEPSPMLDISKLIKVLGEHSQQPKIIKQVVDKNTAKLRKQLNALKAENERLASSPDMSNAPSSVIQFRNRPKVKAKALDKKRKIKEFKKLLQSNDSKVSADAKQNLEMLGVSTGEIAEALTR